MDRDEALRLLNGGPVGVEEWNRRRESGEVVPDLSGADLRGADLRGADLRDAKLRRAGFGEISVSASGIDWADQSTANRRKIAERFRRANLSWADLRGADLFEAVLISGDLSNADLRKADLHAADLRWATLCGADLRRSDLGWANLSDADLTGANIRGAICRRTIFVRINMSEVRGLDSVKHEGPSTISTDTLFFSRGGLHKAFLRGCGLPDGLIEYLPSLIDSMQAIQFYSCFISYSSRDQAFADRLHSRMVQEKLRVWYAPKDMRGGRLHEEQVEQAIRVHDKLLLALSKASMASGWVQWEIDKALQSDKAEGRRRLFPIRLVSLKAIQTWDCRDPRTGRDYAKEILKYHVSDFSNWKDHDAFEAAFARLIRDLKTTTADEELGGDGPPERP
jgi:uncharacterized protein YjbI with pentapeptide repeats